MESLTKGTTAINQHNHTSIPSGRHKWAAFYRESSQGLRMAQGMGSVLIDKDCSTAGCWTLRAEVHWPVTLSRLSQESRSLSQPMGMQQAWDQATKAVSRTRSGSAKSMNSHRHSCKAKPRTRGKRLSKNKTPEQKMERLLSACSHTVLHSNTATLHQS